MLDLASCSVDLVRGVVVRAGTSTALTTREADLLRYFAAHPSVVVGRDELLGEVWGYADSVVTRACDNTVRRLREKIESDPARPDHVLTVHGVGYRFEPAVAAVPEPPPVVERATVAVGAARVDIGRRRIVRSDGDRALSESEAAILAALLNAEGRVVDRHVLQRAAWANDRVHRSALDGAIRQLRLKIEPDPTQPRILVTARGGGYRLDPAPSPPDPRPGAVRFGRVPEVARVQAALAAGERALLLGPAGIGKSTVARAVADSAEDAVWVDLATATSLSTAAVLALQALGVDPGAEDPLARLRRAGVQARTLVVLDNVDPVASDAGALAEALGARPVLATSRVRIPALGGAVIEVPPLDPNDAVALFVARAVASTSANVGIERHLNAIAQIVDHLDRIPLAIELAAARTSTLGPPELAARLGIELLVKDGGDPRHRSLQAAIAASIAALPPRAREALRDLTQFRAGFTLEDADELLGDGAVDVLQQLRDHSLLRTDRGPAGLRFDTWQAVHEHHDALGRSPAERRRFAVCLARYGDDEDLGFSGPGSEIAGLLARSADLVRATRAALDEVGDVDLAARCATAATHALLETGPFAPALALVDDVLRAGPSDPLAARLLLQRAQLGDHLGRGDPRGPLDPPASLDPRGADLEDAVARAERCGALGVLHRALGALSRVRSDDGDHATARVLSERALAAAERWDPASGAAHVHAARIALFDRDEEGQVVHLERGVAAARAAGDALLSMELLRALGTRELFLGSFRRSRACLEEYRELASALGLPGQQATATIWLLQTLVAAGAEADAARWTPVALALAARVGSVRLQFVALHQAARSALLSGRISAAEAALVEADALPATTILRAYREETWADLALAAGDAASARARALDAADRFAHADRDENLALARSRAALASFVLGDRSAAEALMAQACAGVADAGRSRRRTSVLCTAALLDRACGRLDLAARRFDHVRVRSAGELDGDTEPDLVRVWVGPWAVGLLDPADRYGPVQGP